MVTSDFYVLLGLAATALAVWLLRLRLHAPKRTMRALNRNQQQALQALEERGFTLVAASFEIPMTLVVADRSYREAVKADLVVRKAGRRYVVLLSSDLAGGRINTAWRRRYLMSMMWAFRPYAFLIFSSEKAAWREVRVSTPGVPTWILPLLAGLLLGVVLGIRL